MVSRMLAVSSIVGAVSLFGAVIMAAEFSPRRQRRQQQDAPQQWLLAD